jgi:hypothetical protein
MGMGASSKKSRRRKPPAGQFELEAVSRHFPFAAPQLIKAWGRAEAGKPQWGIRNQSSGKCAGRRQPAPSSSPTKSGIDEAGLKQSRAPMVFCAGGSKSSALGLIFSTKCRHWAGRSASSTIMPSNASGDKMVFSKSPPGRGLFFTFTGIGFITYRRRNAALRVA